MANPRGDLLKYLGVKYAFPPTYVSDRAPLVTDIQDEQGLYKVPSIWIHTKSTTAPVDADVWILVNLQANNANGATWLLFTGGTGGSVTELRADDGNVAVPLAGIIDIDGNSVNNGTHPTPLFTRANIPNTVDIDLQVAAAITGAPADKNDAGIASFDDTQFTVDANGFVQLIGGGIAADQFNVDAFTAPGTDPVVPDGTGEVGVFGNLVNAHSIPIETHSRQANEYNIEPQVANAVASSTRTENGMCHFDNTFFSIDTDGFVTATGLMGFTWVVEIGATRNLNNNQGVFGNRGTAQTFTLPATASVGDTIRVVQMGAGNITIDYGVGQLIHFGNTDSTTTTGSIVSTDVGDAVELVCNVANTEWHTVSAVGNWNVL